MNILLTVEELAKYLKIKPDTIYKKVRKGELPAVKLGKLVRFPKELIDEWIVDQAAKTMKDVKKEVKAARKKVNSEVRTAVREVKAAHKKVNTEVKGMVRDARKSAKTTAKVAKRVLRSDVPVMFESLKNAPLNKKQSTLNKGLKTIWKDFNKEMAAAGHKTKRKHSSARKAKTATSTTKRRSTENKAAPKTTTSKPKPATPSPAA